MRCPIHPHYNGYKKVIDRIDTYSDGAHANKKEYGHDVPCKPDYICHRCWEIYMKITKPKPLMYSPCPEKPTIEITQSNFHSLIGVASPESYPPNWCSTCRGQDAKFNMHYIVK